MRQLHSHFIKLNRAREAKNAADILIATDHSALVEVIQHHGGRAVITGVTFQHLVTKWPIQYDRFDIFKISPCRCRLPIGNRSCPSCPCLRRPRRPRHPSHGQRRRWRPRAAWDRGDATRRRGHGVACPHRPANRSFANKVLRVHVLIHITGLCHRRGLLSLHAVQ